jgi:hypothetical protein
MGKPFFDPLLQEMRMRDDSVDLGVSFQGAYAVGTAYTVGQSVSYSNILYVCIQDGAGQQPDTATTYWSKITSKGDAGAQGATGADGLDGAEGATGPQGSAGPQGVAGVDGDAGGQIFNVAGPADPDNTTPGGSDGDHCLKLSDGSMWERIAGTWTDTGVVMKGSQGDTGATGSQGATGAQGDTGSQGIQGIQGIQGEQGPAGDGAGDIVGPASATDNAIARFDATTGKLVQNSSVTVDDSGNIATSGTVDDRDLSADGSKLDAIESSATADQTGAEIKTAYEAEADTNAFTDAEQTKLTGVESGATADQTGAEIKTAYEAEADTNAYTDTEKAKLAGVEASATADQTNVEIKTAYEANADTNEFSDAEQTKLAGIETAADVTDATNVAAAGATMDSDFSSNGRMVRTGSGTYITILDKLDGTTAPGVNDDTGSGFTPGSNWVNVTGDKAYVCVDASSGAAVWIETTQVGGGEGGGTAVITKSTFSAAANVDLTAFDSGTYDAYRIYLYGAPADDSSKLFMRTSTDGGTTFDSGSNYKFSGKITQLGQTTDVTAGATNSKVELVSLGLGNAVGENFNIIVDMSKPDEADKVGFTWRGTFVDDAGNSHRVRGGASKINVEDIDAIQFYGQLGNITGSYVFLGIKNA